VRNVVETNRGAVIISSGEGIYTCVADGKLGSKRTAKQARWKYPGTMIKISLDIKKFVPDEVTEEEFTWE
jgi:hypothetical protein